MNKIKNLFATPKKAIFTLLCLIIIFAVLSVGTMAIASAAIKSSSIGEENARNFAFADAGVDPVSAEAVRTKFDFEQGQFVYEVEFISGGTEYEYWIKATDGSVVKKEIEIIGPDGTNTMASAQITMDAAKETALSNAELAASDVTFTKTKLDIDDGISVYEFEFYAGNTKYEYEINANTGAIYSKSKETVEPQTATDSNTPNPQNSSQNQSPSNQISLEEAKSKALADAGISASEATFTKAKQDRDDGILMYEIEFYTSSYEYDYEINAATGQIHSRDSELLKSAQSHAGSSQSTANYIGVERAKSIAVSHAGFSASDVKFSKAKLDDDDGYIVYEIEFYKDGAEYEYTINASTGDIMEYDCDWDD